MKVPHILAAAPADVDANIRRYQSEARKNAELARRAGQAKEWFALFDDESGWIFGPSKFVGYAGNTAARYLASAREFASGGETEKHLRKWYQTVDKSSQLGQDLHATLATFLAGFDKRPSKAARICVEKTVLARSPDHGRENATARISSRPDVCAGRPCIRDTRVRVSDVLDMLAAGASAQDILADYAYLTSEDISAALAYAALATDHVVVRAA